MVQDLIDPKIVGDSVLFPRKELQQRIAQDRISEKNDDDMVRVGGTGHKQDVRQWWRTETIEVIQRITGN
jgi:hypothetical protein